jgi:predicted PurR-regulated permease PerM
MMMNGWMVATGFGVTHWLFFAALVAVLLYPIGRILNRVGLSPFWSVLALVPLINMIGLWILAFVDWPGQKGGS